MPRVLKAQGVGVRNSSFPSSSSALLSIRSSLPLTRPLPLYFKLLSFACHSFLPKPAYIHSLTLEPSQPSLSTLSTVLFRAPVAVVAALLANQVSPLFAVCSAGKYIDSLGKCKNWADGTVNANPVSGSSPTSCTPCSAGQGSNSGHTQCSTCTTGRYATGGTVCMSCPAGQTNTSNHQGCQKCAAGTSNPSAGGSCMAYPKGSFNNVAGAKSCCSCCAGWYSDSTGSTSCQQCPTTNPYSAVGSDDSNDCKNNPGSGPNKLPDFTLSCSMVADNVCPNPNGNGPQGTAISGKRRNVQCTKGFEECPRFSGRGGFDCVDTENDPESCVGCRSLDRQGSGTDCTAIKGASVTRCVKKSCVVDSCRKGWTRSSGGSLCIPRGSHSVDPRDPDSRYRS